MFEIAFYITQGDPHTWNVWKSAESVVVLIYNQDEGMNSKLNPYYLDGLVDGEGCFSITFNRHKNNRIEIRLLFEIELREDDREILERVQKTLECGNIYYLNYARYSKWKPHVKYKVSNLQDITQKVIPFFNRYPLQAKKRKSFEVFSKVAQAMIQKKHLTPEGILEIKDLKEGMK